MHYKLHSDCVHYVALACEEGGRWGPDVFKVVADLVKLKVAPLHLREAQNWGARRVRVRVRAGVRVRGRVKVQIRARYQLGLGHLGECLDPSHERRHESLLDEHTWSQSG